jgi:hypothetical protein
MAWNCARVLSLRMGKACATDCTHQGRLPEHGKSMSGKGRTRQEPIRKSGQTQTLATLGATRVDDGTTATGLHAHQKTVGAGAADFGRLVCAFHGELPRKNSDENMGIASG